MGEGGGGGGGVIINDIRALKSQKLQNDFLQLGTVKYIVVEIQRS